MMRRTKMLGGMMATATLSIPTKLTKLVRLLLMWKLTCASEIVRLARVDFKWTRWMSRRLRSTTGIGRPACDNSSCSQIFSDFLFLHLHLRYNEDTAAIQRFGEGGEEMSDEITQQTLLPEVKDPNLWMVKCRWVTSSFFSLALFDFSPLRIGEEKVTVLQMMRKMIAYQFEDEPLQIR